MQRHVLQRAANRGIDPLPRAADAAQTLDAALARGAAAFGDGDRTFEHIENLRRGNLLGISREPIAALRTARGNHHARALQALEHLAHRGPAEARALSQFGGGAVASRLLR